MRSNYIDELVYYEVDGTGYYPLQGVNYNIEAVSNEAGAIVEWYQISPFGQVKMFNGLGEDITETGSRVSNRHTFQGRDYDEDLGMFYFRNRWMSPTMGRFISRDPMRYGAGDINLYRFVGNSGGINALDPMGLKIIRISFMGTGDISGSFAKGASKVFDSWNLNGALAYVYDELKELDDNKDGILDQCDKGDADIRITGYSHGGWTALKLAQKINLSYRLQDKRYKKVRLGMLDPVNNFHIYGGSAQVPSNVSYSINVYQRNGCPESGCRSGVPISEDAIMRGVPIQGTTEQLNVTDLMVGGEPINHLSIIRTYGGAVANKVF